MARYDTKQLRNIVLLSHSGAGKTIASEAMLHVAGLTSRLGTVEDGTTSSDFEPEEIRRQGSVQSSVISCLWNGHKINVLDTPGYADFRGEVISSVHVADAAVFVIACPSGPEVGTTQMWSIADARSLPRLIYLSKMDKENADFNRSMDLITERFGRKCVPIQIPVGSESEFNALVNLLDSESITAEQSTSDVEAARERLIESVAESDDGLATKYLEGEDITQDELIHGLKQGVLDGKIIPVLVGNSTEELGTKELLNCIVDLLPSPSDVKEDNLMKSVEAIPLNPDSQAPLAALIFKTSADPFVGKLSYFRTYRGTISSDSQIWNANTNESERIGQLFSLVGKEQSAESDLAAGDIGATAKLNSSLTGHTLCEKDHTIQINPPIFPRPVYQMAVFPKTQADVDKMSTSLTRIAEEDPSLEVIREPNTLEILIGGLGDTHVEIAVEKMKRKFGSEMILEVPKVPYKETIASTTKVEYRHKKQSGGHGQFGHVWLELEPLPRGEGFAFEESVVGGSVPREYIPAVEKGVVKAMADGAIAGYPIVDVKATLFDGSYHTVDSSGICFEIAGAAALTRGVQQATPALLEPIMQATISVPDDFAGEIIGDLNSKRGRIQGMTPQGNGITIIETEVPQAEMLRYATDMRSITQGQGTFTTEFSHYDQVPGHMVEQIIQETRAKETSRV